MKWNQENQTRSLRWWSSKVIKGFLQGLILGFRGRDFGVYEPTILIFEKNSLMISYACLKYSLAMFIGTKLSSLGSLLYENDCLYPSVCLSVYMISQKPLQAFKFCFRQSIVGPLFWIEFSFQPNWLTFDVSDGSDLKFFFNVNIYM